MPLQVIDKDKCIAPPRGVTASRSMIGAVTTDTA